MQDTLICTYGHVYFVPAWDIIRGGTPRKGFGILLEYVRNIPGKFLDCHGIFQEYSRSIPGIFEEYSRNILEYSIWAQAPVGPAQVGLGPSGPGPKWARAQVGPGIFISVDMCYSINPLIMF